MELSAKCVAMNYAFEVVEQHNPPIPEALQLRIAFWSFPESEEEIRLYSCLACGSNDKFKEGQFLALSGHVIEVLQIGMYLQYRLPNYTLLCPYKCTQVYCIIYSLMICIFQNFFS